MKTSFNWGIIGAGKIAKKFALGLEHVTGGSLYAIASRSENKAQDFAADFKAKKAFGDYESMLQDPELDVVYIATPHVFHLEHTLLCLKHKKAVLCEKPFAMDRAQVEKMIDFAQKQDVFLMEAMWTHFLPHFRYVVDIIKAETYGKITALEADFGFEAPVDFNNRIYNKSLGGGSLLDIGIYPIFAALSFLGKPDKIEAKAKMTKTEVDAQSEITFYYPNKVQAQLASSIDKETSTIAKIQLEKAKILINSRFHEPSTVTITTEKEQFTKEFGVTSNGYNFEAEHVQQMLAEGRKESSEMSFAKSLELIEMLDRVRKKIGLKY
ncbi:Gfo/Idh/MocA family protein [Zunongwangia sp.]|uniref:Gfo/Idh/MocA family protein n=1 Tax=Zunongwangia sp. TaxID=1965325 RepID=UPI003AA9596D